MRRLGDRRLRWAASGLMVAGLGAVGVAAAPAGTDGSQAASGTLDLQVTFGMVSNLVACPAGVPPSANECRARTGKAVVPGLGPVTETYTWPLTVGPPTCPDGFNKPLAATGQLSIAGKGEITFTLAEGARCAEAAVAQNEPQEFTITGGMGSFAEASGRGTVAGRAIGMGVGSERLTGTLEVPGVTFDLTPPVISGATNKTVKAKKGAKSARVTFRVSAQDGTDGVVPVGCNPRSGNRFPLGRTRVTCEATDSSGNTATAAFRITVRATR